ncbi:MAG: type III pantothenate kinase [Armatimonadota bacterium]
MSRWRLYADAGNTALKWAVYADGRWSVEGRIDAGGLPDAGAELAGVPGLAGFDPAECAGVALVSSRPGQAEYAERALEVATGRGVRVLGRDMRTEVAVAYHDPTEIGQDRLAAAEGALSLAGAPAIVLTLGTCITAQVLNADGRLAGGAIAAGLEAQVAGISASVPHLREAVEAALALLRSGESVPSIGRSTVENLALGLAASLRGAVKALVDSMREEVGEAPVVATGGDAELAARLGAVFDRVEPRLVLEGLRVVDERTDER